MFAKILIANRGEIAARVIRTARGLGIATVAVHSDADADALHVRLADEAYGIGPAPSAESYLKGEKILAVARRAGAEAIHPGYGFLAENADFAEACAAAGVTFIGPPPAAIRAMGLKDAAKARMAEAGVPTVPGDPGADQAPDRLAREAARIGYPVLIKAVAGGGGKGMRQVDDPADFEAALSGAKREAQAAFGDDRVLLEKYLSHSRHIEVQVFADGAGNALHLFERDCSIQRRHQKVIEEAPAPGLTEEMRAAMGEAAVAAARAIGYQGAGTVEFIADVTEGLKADRFYFLEMNTRLQVEHPVTEMVTGIDLVEWQIRVAAGEPLPRSQADLRLDGHAIEARIYAEDPAQGFLPATGPLLRFRLPTPGRHVRIDAGVAEGGAVGTFYDPMIAKLIVWDRDRRAAIRRLGAALREVRIAGVTTNLGFLGRVARHPAFEAGELDTGFIARHAADLMPAPSAPADRTLALAALAVLVERRLANARAQAGQGDPHSPWASTLGWRLNGVGHDVLTFAGGETEVPVTVRYPGGPVYLLDLPGGPVRAEGSFDASGDLAARLDGERLTATVVRAGDEITVIVGGEVTRLTVRDPLHVEIEDEDVAGSVSAPLPGKVIQVLVAPGAEVEKGTPLIIVEAMKMEHTITAPAAGTVARVNFAADDQVEEGAVLVAFEEEDEP